jgi:NAD(P)-dependent dehydrogenase (short-subunit alcohol dehydrogenase family)
MVGDTFAEMGASVAVLDRTREICDTVAQDIAARRKVATLGVPIELENEAEVATVHETVRKHFGRLDILVHCAALVGTSPLEGWAVPFEEQSLNTWRRAHEVNVTAGFHLIQSCADLLKASGHGSVIAVSSIYGVVAPDFGLYEGTQMGNPAAYASSKAGLLQLTRWLSTALAPRVRVNAITPGGVFANQDPAFVARYEKRTPMGRMAGVEDFKGAMAYLASDLSAYVTGQNLVVDGGWTAW